MYKRQGCYGLDIDEDLSSLIDQVVQIPKDFRIRVGMMNPMFMPRIRDNLLKSFENSKVFRFLHIPVQSGSNVVLNDMKRGHTVETFKNVVNKFRTKFGSFTISTDIIIGYPTETQENFEETIELLKETTPDIVNISRYSRRPGTIAAEMPQIDVAEIKRRSKQATELINKISLENNKKWEIITAARFDHHDQIDEGIQFAPKFGIFYKPSTLQTFRLTYGKAYNTPSALNLHTDLFIGKRGIVDYYLRGNKDGTPYYRVAVSYTHLTLPTNREV
mgnify:CR=1 FL=1